MSQNQANLETPEQIGSNGTEPNWIKPEQTGATRIKQDQTRPNRTKSDQTGPNWNKKDKKKDKKGPNQTKKGSNQTKLDQTGKNWTKPDQTWTSRDKTGSYWTKSLIMFYLKEPSTGLFWMDFDDKLCWWCATNFHEFSVSGSHSWNKKSILKNRPNLISVSTYTWKAPVSLHSEIYGYYSQVT